MVSLRKNITSLYTENRYKPHRFSIIIVSNSYIYNTYKYCTQAAAVSVSEKPVKQAVKKRKVEVFSQTPRFKCKNSPKCLYVQICLCVSVVVHVSVL